MTEFNQAAQKREKPHRPIVDIVFCWAYPALVAVGGLILVDWYFALHLDHIAGRELSSWLSKITTLWDTLLHPLRDMLRLILP